MSKADWAGASLPAMWNSAQAADTQMAWNQVLAWQQTFELLLHHEGRLKACRDQLTYAWPPERSPAATAFVEYINGLLVAIGRAKEDAVENHRALAGVLTSLSATKSDMAKLKAEWDEQEAFDSNMARKLPNDMFASGDTWQEDLNQKARARMTQNDQEVFEATQKMVEMTPPNGDSIFVGVPFDPSSQRSNSDETGGSRSPIVGGSEGWVRPPEVASVGAVGDSSDPASAVVQVGADESDIALPGLAGSGESFGRPGQTAPTLSAPVDTGSNSPSSFALPTSVGKASGVGVGSRGATNSRRGPLSPTHSAIPPDSVGKSRSGPIRIGPVGGVIESGARPAISGAMPIGSFGSVGGGVADSREPTPILQWEVSEGGAPVIEPATERLFQLEPGIIGVDRV